jgi:hypothetical protein
LPNIIHREMVLRACILALVATSAHGTNDAWKEISSQLEAEQAHTVAASSVVDLCVDTFKIQKDPIALVVCVCQPA